MKEIKAVIFDLDGLLIDSEIIAKTAWSRALEDFHYHLSDDFYLQLIGVTLKDEINMFYQEFGNNFPFDRVYAKRQIYFDEIIENEGINLKIGALDLINLLDRAGIKMCIATSSSRVFASKKLSFAGLNGKFDTIVCGDDVKHGKPSPDIFIEAAKRIDCSTRECIVMEDSEAGIIAAHTAGIVTFLIPDLQKPSPTLKTKCYRIFNSLIEVKDYLADVLA
jgi:beta-phosphoglucomutase